MLDLLPGGPDQFTALESRSMCRPRHRSLPLKNPSVSRQSTADLRKSQAERRRPAQLRHSSARSASHPGFRRRRAGERQQGLPPDGREFEEQGMSSSRMPILSAKSRCGAAATGWRPRERTRNSSPWRGAPRRTDRKPFSPLVRAIELERCRRNRVEPAPNYSTQRPGCIQGSSRPRRCESESRLRTRSSRERSDPSVPRHRRRDQHRARGKSAQLLAFSC